MNRNCSHLAPPVSAVDAPASLRRRSYGSLAWLITVLLILIRADAAPLLRPTDERAAFESANRLYEQGKYREAAAAYRSLLDARKSSPNVWFNLGNALFKSGEVGQAIAAYRRAERLAPRDPDTRANLSFAREQARGPTPPGGFWQRYLGQFTVDEWTLATAAPVWLSLLLLSFAQWQPSRWLTLRGWIYAGVALGLFLACCTAAAYQQRDTRIAVITADLIDVRHGPLEESQAAFNLHDGAETLVVDEKDNWLRVNAATKGTGWIPKQAAVLLP